jgi:hypothetical protein
MFTRLHKGQQCHQTSFSTPDDGRLGRNMLCQIRQIKRKNGELQLQLTFRTETSNKSSCMKVGNEYVER